MTAPKCNHCHQLWMQIFHDICTYQHTSRHTHTHTNWTIHNIQFTMCKKPPATDRTSSVVHRNSAYEFHCSAAKRPFKVIYCKVSKGAIIIFGLIFEGSKQTVIKIIENRHFRPPHCLLMCPLQRMPANIYINLKPSETRVPGLHFCCRKYGLVFI